MMPYETDKVDSKDETKLSRYIKLGKLLPKEPAEMEDQIMDSLKTCDDGVDPPVAFLLKKACRLLYDDHFEDCIATSQQILDKAWEKLNSYHWKDVPLVWQKVYSYGCVLKACGLGHCIESDEDSKELCHVADMGLLMGYDVMNGILHEIISIFKPVQSVIIPKKESLCESVKLPKIVNQIPVISSPSLEYFQTECMKEEKPLILKDCIEHWPSRSLWNFEYLNKVAGHRLVPVEVGSKYTDESWGQKLMLISDFVQKYVLSQEKNGPRAYLAQHRLFDQIPSLKEDICIPDYCCISGEEDNDPDLHTEVNAWFGPKGTVSPCHHDPKHNLLAQVVGRKYVCLYPKSCSAPLYPHEGMMNNTSRVDIENPDSEKFPLFKEMDSSNRTDCILHPGQMLYIPPRCWHYIRSLDESFSVSFWWS